MNKTIIFDFNRTLFNPDTNQLMDGARELLESAKAKSYTLILVAQASATRAQLLKELGLADLFTAVHLVESKSSTIFRQIAQDHQVDLAHSFVIGDRAHREVLYGYQAGWQTIWLAAGKFKDELPSDNEYQPTHVITHLTEAVPLI